MNRFVDDETYSDKQSKKEEKARPTPNWYTKQSLTPEQKKAQSERETASWLVKIKKQYPEHYDNCKSEIDLYRKNPEKYKQVAAQKVKDVCKNMVIDYDDIPF